MYALDAAITYGSWQWHVLPLHYPLSLGGCSCARRECKSIGKHPLTWHGLYEASTDEAQIRAWWRRWPRANVGIATGAVSGFDVLDIDPRNGGNESLADLIARHGSLPETVEQLTGGGGRHLLFVHAAGVEWPKSLAPGLDTRTDGALIVAPPSLHASGNLYAWELSSDPADTPVAAWPDWLLALAVPATVRRQPDLARRQPDSPIPDGRWSRVLAGCKRLREMESVQHARGLSYHEWLAAVSVARLGGSDGTAWAIELTQDYMPGSTLHDLAKLAGWVSGNLQGTATCEHLGCHPGRCNFWPRADISGRAISPSPLRHAWGKTINVEVRS